MPVDYTELDQKVDYQSLPERQESIGMWNAYKVGWEQSPTGMVLFGLPSGEEELDLKFWEKAAKGVGTFTDPISLALFFAGGGVGGAAAKKLGVEGIKRVALRRGLASGIKQSGALTAHAVGGEVTQKKVAGEPIDYKELAKIGGKAALTGLALTPAAMIPGAAKLAKLGRFGAESATFAAVPPALEGRLPTAEEALLAPATLGVAKAAMGPLALLAKQRTPTELQREVGVGKPKAGPQPVGRTSVGRSIVKKPGRQKLTIDDYYSRAIDDLHPIKRVVDVVKRAGVEVAAESDPYVLARNSRGWLGRASDFLENDLRPILRGLSKKELAELDEYLVARRVASRADKYTPEALQKAKIDPADVPKVLKDLAQYEEIALKLDAYNDKMLSFTLGKESADYQRIKAKNDFYVPLYRDYSPDGAKWLGPRGKFAAKSPIKALKGESERQFESPLEGIVKNTYTLSRFREFNRVGEALVDLADKSGLEGIADPVPPPPGGAIPSNKPIIKVRDGWYRVDEELFTSFQNLNREALNSIVRLMGLPARALRVGATTTPEFGIRNPVRDVQTAMIYSKYGFTPVDFFKGLFESIKKGDKYQEWRRSGGEHAALVSLDRVGLQDSLAKVLAGRAGKVHPRTVIKHPIETLRIFSEWTESATRLGEYMKARQKGTGPVEAAYDARDITLDFARMGPWSRQANAIIAFFNANIQGMDKMYREFKARPAKTMGRVAAQITIPSILLALHNRRDPRWKDIRDWEKNVFWIIMTEDHIWRIPKPFDLGVLFGSIPERMVEWIVDNDPSQGEAIMSALGDLTPEYVPTSLNPALEVYANKSRFTGAPIVPESKKKLPAALQSKKHTGRAARELGRVLGYSPAKIEHLVRGYTGGFGQYALDIAGAGFDIAAPEEKPIAPAKTPADLPVVRAFTTRYPTPSGQLVNEFYAMAEESERLYRARKELDLGDDRTKIMRAHRVITIYKSRLAAQRKRAERVEKSSRYSAEQKRERLDKIYKKMADLAGKALETLRSQ